MTSHSRRAFFLPLTTIAFVAGALTYYFNRANLVDAQNAVQDQRLMSIETIIAAQQNAIQDTHDKVLRLASRFGIN